MVYGFYQQTVIDPGNYTGALDEKGLRSGIGSCKWSDGDVYEGDWKNNLRHGNGKFTDKGHFDYKG